jgi:hypothetical protein
MTLEYRCLKCGDVKVVIWDEEGFYPNADFQWPVNCSCGGTGLRVRHIK